MIASPHPLGAALEWRVPAYDLLYDELSAKQRVTIETKFREYIRYAIKPGGTYDTSIYNNERNYARYDGENGSCTRTNWLPNIIFPWKISANLMAAVLRDETFEGKARVVSFERIAAADDAVAVRVTGEKGRGIDDRLMVRVGDRAQQPIALAGGGESFTFAGHAFVRNRGQTVVVRGSLSAMVLRE